MDNLGRQVEIEFVIAHSRCRFEWFTRDKQLFFWGKDTYLYWWLMKPLIYIYIYRYVLNERESHSF